MNQKFYFTEEGDFVVETNKGVIQNGVSNKAPYDGTFVCSASTLKTIEDLILNKNILHLKGRNLSGYMVVDNVTIDLTKVIEKLEKVEQEYSHNLMHFEQVKVYVNTLKNAKLKDRIFNWKKLTSKHY